MAKYIIVDDEPLAHDLIERFCGMLPHLELAGHCYDAIEAMQYLNGHTVDLMFLDLNMPKIHGFAFLKTLPNPPKVIVTTAYQEFALEGYELNVADYLLKPFSFDRLLKAVNKALASPTAPSTPPHPASESTRFFIKGDRKHHQINSQDILYIEAYGNYTKIHLASEMVMAHEGISALASQLPPANFLRVHKSFIVALDKISTVEGNQLFIQQHTLPIGQTYRRAVNQVLGK